MIRVMHLITGLRAGGAEAMLAKLVNTLDRDSFENIVVSMTDGGELADRIKEAGVAVFHLGLSPGVPDPRAYWRLRALIRMARPDILQTWLYHADLLGSVVAAGDGPQLVWNLRCSDMSQSGWRTRGLPRRLAPL